VGLPELKWWKKWVDDLSSTRIQLTYLVAGLFSSAVIQGIRMIHNVSDAVQMVTVLTVPFIGVLGYHLTGKWMDAKQNGNGAPTPPPAVP
jgi:hypothetical protein